MLLIDARVAFIVFMKHGASDKRVLRNKTFVYGSPQTLMYS
jgi:hypothetical protein